MKYRTSGAWGSGEGRRLTSAEIDQNFYDVVQRLDAVEADVAAGWNPISNITSTGGSLYIHLTSGTIFGPLPFPAARWNDAGTWLAGTTYYPNDLITIEGDGVYHVLQAHVAEATFDADQLIGGERVYNLMIAIPNPAPIINVTAEVVVLTSAHANAYVRCDHPAGIAVYIEAGTFNPPTEIHFRQVNTGGIALNYGDSGTFINVPDGYLEITGSQGSVMCLKCVADNEFDLFGTLVPA